jgi:hypothetical protein
MCRDVGEVADDVVRGRARDAGVGEVGVEEVVEWRLGGDAGRGKRQGGERKGELLRLPMIEAALATSGEVEVRMARTLEAAEMEPARLSPNLDCLMRELLTCCASLLKKLSRAKGLPGS